jgi:glycerol-3-phosphate acyltransferase PlsY
MGGTSSRRSGTWRRPGSDPSGDRRTSFPVDLLVAALALIGGYLAGSVPLSSMVGRAAGVDVVRAGEADPGPAGVWRLAGPGWGLLALTGELAKGLLPVAIGVVTWSWWAGWAAGLGALVGAGWPLFGRLPGGRGLAALAGVALALSPVAGLVSLLLASLVIGTARLLGGDGRTAAIATGFGAYALLFLLDQADLARLAGIGVLYLVAVLRLAMNRH